LLSYSKHKITIVNNNWPELTHIVRHHTARCLTHFIEDTALPEQLVDLSPRLQYVTGSIVNISVTSVMSTLQE